MASVQPQKPGQLGEILTTKRPHVKTEKMQEFLNMKHKDPESSPQKLLKCPQEGCDKVLTSSPGLRYHMKTHYGLDRPYMCVRCHKTFKSANGLKYHTMKTKCEGSGDMEYSAAVNLSSMFDLEPVAEECVHTSSDEDMKLTDTEPMDSCQMLDEESHPKVKPPPLALMGHGSSEDLMSSEDQSADEGEHHPNLLTQLAIIATGPQSPLLQKSHTFGSPGGSDSSSLHSYAKPPQFPLSHPHQNDQSTEQVDNVGPVKDESESRVSSSSPFPAAPPKDSDSNGNWSHSWPTAVWQCFIKGTRVRFTSGPRTEWQSVEEISYTECLKEKASQTTIQTSYAPNGLRLLNIEECRPTDNNSNRIMRLRFTSGITGQPELIAECALDHPFFVKDKGWSSFHPSRTASHYGIPCNELDVNDLCLPPSHPEATFTTDVFNSFKSYDFTPMDSSAVFTLSSMAQQKRDLELSPVSCPGSPSKKRPARGADPNKAKRPMNAFMLFAKRFRVEYNQMYPGKDNRAISVMLGDRWKKMCGDDRKEYEQKAKVLAEQHKKIHPDCWKRRRNPSGSGDS